VTSKTLSVTEEIYDMLVKLKLPQESFGDVIKRLCLEKSARNLVQWVETHPLWSDMTEEEIEHMNGISKKINTKFTINEVDLE
jgi:predicted CopG family antitoxin